jgi:hypothetical protein
MRTLNLPVCLSERQRTETKNEIESGADDQDDNKNKMAAQASAK